MIQAQELARQKAEEIARREAYDMTNYCRSE
jgi:hypothetical protein